MEIEIKFKYDWISVAEKLPNKNGDYLVYTEWQPAKYYLNNISIASYAKNLHIADDFSFPLESQARPGWYSYDSQTGVHYELGNITYWMPLPIPPSGE